MLKEMTIKNFRSFNQEETFSMEADIDRVSEHNEHVVDVCDNHILKVSSMYGPNGGGKSNVLFALQLAKNIVFNNNQSSISPSRKLKCEFSNSQSIEETIFFVSNNYEIGYYFEVEPKTVTQENIDFSGNKVKYFINYFDIKNETVSYRKKGEEEFVELLERDTNGLVKSEILKKININLNQNLSSNNSCLLYLFNTYLNRKEIKQEELKVLNDLIYEINSISPLEIEGNINFEYATTQVNKYKYNLIKLLDSVDIKIKDIIINKNDIYRPIQFVRMINGEEKILDLYDESRGTIKIFWMLLNLLIANNESRGLILYCDDMNAYLHPKLYRAIIELLNSKENNNNQLIFNSHDILNMDKELFRRDEIWFVYRDDSYQTKLVPLSNIVNYKGEQVRKDAKYYKQYLEGKYGADPFIKKGLSFNE